MIKTFIKILSLSKEYKYWMLLAAFMGFLTVGSGIGLMMTSAYIISKAALHVHIHQLQVGIVGVRFFGISRGVFRYLERLVSHETTFRLLAKFRYWFFKSIEPVMPSKTQDFTSGDLLNRSIADIDKLEHIFVRVISPPIVAVFTLMLMFSLLAIFNIYYSLVFSLLYIFTATVIPLSAFLLSRNYGKEILKLKSMLSTLIVDASQGMNELIAFGKTEEWEAEFNAINRKLLQKEKRMNSIQGINNSLIGFMMNFTVLILFLIAAPDVNSGALNGFSLPVILIGLMAAFEALLPIPLALQYFEQSVEAANRLFEIAELESEQKETSIDSEIITQNGISFNSVNFSYDNKIVCDNISFDIRPNTFTAIVGGTGAGKSTLVNLITKLWTPDSGAIEIGNRNIQFIRDENVRDKIAVAPQTVDLFTGTIRENLAVANEKASENEMMQVLSLVKLDALINGLPQKLDTAIGELGKILSGGERKRLALARALLKNTDIVIADEITNGLDPITEIEILRELKQLSKEKTIVLITHRLVEMDQYENIIVLSNGKACEQGTHQHLYEKRGVYKKLYDSFHQLIES